MGIIEKIKSNIEMWKIDKYTKRRHVTTPEFEQRDREFYRQNYKDGVYLNQITPNSNEKSSVNRRTTLLRTKSEKIMRSSENYNKSH